MKRPVLQILTLAVLAAFIVLLTSPSRLYERRLAKRFGPVIHESQSAYSHIRVRERNEVRNLFFVDKHGKEQRQSAIDLQRPEVMELAYTKAFFLSYLFRFPQDRVLIVGLGGGGMVRFLNHHFPETVVEAVEIDPAVVVVARDFFGTKAGPQTKIHTEDAFEFLKEPAHGPFDALYMDAFLKPAAGSGLDRLTRRLKTVEFLHSLKGFLSDGGLVAFNLIDGESTQDDLEALRETFPAVYVFSVPKTRNLIALALQSEEAHSLPDLVERARELDAGLKVGLSFETMVKGLRSQE